MTNNREKIGTEVFQKSTILTDRFHVQQLINEALQKVRVIFRWDSIDEKNEAKKNGKEILFTNLKKWRYKKIIISNKQISII
ncbi:MAG: transposase [Bacteroidetes bacterium]|nr:transposase [Bacteroidota bacterium]